MPREVRQVRDALQGEFDGLIDMSDESGPSEKKEQHFISRALAALVTQKLLGSDRDAAVDALVDGRGDGGIDAIAVSDSGTRIWLIQSKWSDKGKAGFGVGEVLKFREGLKFLDERRFDRGPSPARSPVRPAARRTPSAPSAPPGTRRTSCTARPAIAA
jgi:hypothetical protein